MFFYVLNYRVKNKNNPEPEAFSVLVIWGCLCFQIYRNDTLYFHRQYADSRKKKRNS